MFSKTCGFHKFYNSVSHFCRVSSFILWSLPFPFCLYWFASFDKVYFWLFRCITLTWKLLAVSIASLSTLFYLIFKFLHVLPSSRSQSLMYLTLEKVFSNTLRNIEIRRSQMLYWPILLKENVLR